MSFIKEVSIGNNVYDIRDKNALNTSNISNCLLEIPQDIKLELNNGTLTLKAGSKIYVPNGAGKFDEVVVSNDISRTVSQDETFLYYKDGVLGERPVANSTSGTAQPSTTLSLWYDTTNNIIKSNTTGDFTGNCSLPIARIANGVIDQVFNGFGYIGSTVFALPGVKGLIPDGRNADGTLKNAEGVSSKVITRTFTSGWTNSYTLLFDGTTFSLATESYSATNNTNQYAGARVGGLRLDNDVISNFSTKLPFHAVDYNDLNDEVEKLELNMPVGTILPFGGSAAPTGFLLCNGAKISRTTYASLFAKIGTTYGAGDGSTTFALPNLVNVRMLKGSEIPVVGNGKAIGLTHDNNSTIRSMSWGGLTDTKNGSAALTLSNQNTGNLPQSGSLRGNQSNVNLIGMTKTASLSGVVAQISSGVVVRFIIKY